MIPDRPSRRAFRSAGLLLLLLLMLGAVSPPPVGLAAAPLSVSTPVAEPGPGDADPVLYAPILPDQREEIYAETAGELSRYRIEARLDPGGEDRLTTVTGTEDLLFYNATGGSLTQVFFRLYANGPEYGEGAIVLRDVEVEGARVTPELLPDDPTSPTRGDETIARLPLPDPIPAGGTATIRMGFTTTVPTQPRESYGIFSRQDDVGTVALAHWYPILAGFDATGEPELRPLSRFGDPIFSNTALYDVAITAPADLVLVATGSETEVEEGGDDMRHRYVTGPVRDFTIVADDDYVSVSQEVDGTTVTSYYNPEHAAGGAAVLQYATQSLEIFNDLFGPYPYAELDLVDVALRNGAAGVEFPQLLYIGHDYYDNPAAEDARPGFLEYVVAHEVAHQWWYAMVGNDQYVDAFIDEGLTNYVTIVYFERQYGAEEGALQREINLLEPYRDALVTIGDEVIHQPTDDFPSAGAYGVMTYAKAPLGFEALRAEIGDEAFFAALRTYADRMQFDVAVPADLRAAFERASGQDLAEFWRHWFEAAEGEQDVQPA
ncbi:MAG: M1 family metallopeptidase [Chloroflexota bacterium]|nr:M1 family metallopeptidase [Chloroflexota bacterium]